MRINPVGKICHKLLCRLLGIGISQADCQQDATPDQFDAGDQGCLSAGLTKPRGDAGRAMPFSPSIHCQMDMA
jgi:hypothetical protein